MRRTFVALKSLPALGLGCARIGSFNNPSPLGESIALIRGAMALGVTLLDTANIYGQGDSERAIGEAVRGARDDAFLVTKGGLTFSAKMRLMRPLKPLLRPLMAKGEMDNAATASRAAAMRSDWSEAGLVASLDGSLRRLRTDRVDAFLLHSPSADILARPGPADALAHIAASGRAARVGVACDDLASLDAALAIPGVQILELPWDVLAEIADGPRAAAIAARSIAVIAREVLKLQPGVAPAQAIANARALPIVSTTLIGSRRLDRVRALALQESRP
jgi:pyridoxine 4-dehydrogenase